MRSTVAVTVLLASLLGAGTAGAAECPADALGVSRTLVVDVNEHPRVGSWQYPESLPLNDHEVVLTFDDGPLPPYPDRLLDPLAADDWTHINNREVARRAISRLEARGKGILLLHDIQARTALALPEILQELKARGYKIAHVVPTTADRPKTVTEPELWAARHAP